MARLFVGHDLGTRGNKCVIVDVDGRLLGEAVQSYGIDLTEGGRAEQDPEVWWQAVCACTHDAMRAAGAMPSDIAGVGFAGQMLALAPLDDGLRPSRRAISWLDSRAEHEAEAITRRIGGKSIVSAVAGAVPSGKDIVAKVAWIRAHEPEVFARTRSFGDATGFLVARATGVASCDITCAAGTGMLDPATRGWSRPLAWLARFPTDRMAPLRESSEVVGGLTAESAAQLGLIVGTPVVAGLADIPSAAVGSGCVTAGDVHVYLGTSGWVGATTLKPVAVPRSGIAALPWSLPGTSLTIGEMENAGSCLDWAAQAALFRSEPLTADVYGRFEALAARSRPGCGGVWFLPWIYGERSPFPNERLRGGWMGVSLLSTDADLARAVYEGVAYNLAESLRLLATKGVRPRSLATIGGGALSDVWMQTIADVTGVVVRRTLHTRSAGAIGAALMAAVGVGAIAGLHSIASRIQWGAEFTPDQAANALHRARLPEFVRLAGWMG